MKDAIVVLVYKAETMIGPLLGFNLDVCVQNTRDEI